MKERGKNNPTAIPTVALRCPTKDILQEKDGHRRFCIFDQWSSRKTRRDSHGTIDQHSQSAFRETVYMLSDVAATKVARLHC